MEYVKSILNLKIDKRFNAVLGITGKILTTDVVTYYEPYSQKTDIMFLCKKITNTQISLINMQVQGHYPHQWALFPLLLKKINSCIFQTVHTV